MLITAQTIEEDEDRETEMSTKRGKGMKEKHSGIVGKGVHTSPFLRFPPF